MTELAGEVAVKIRGDLTQFEKDLAEAERRTREFDRAASTAGSAQSKLSGSFAGAEAAIAKMASGVEMANAALARLEKSVIASNVARQTAAKSTIQEARASENVTAAVRQEALANDRLTESINRQNAAIAARARSRAAAGVDAWGRTPTEVTAHVAATQGKGSPITAVGAIPVSANTRADLTKAEALTRTASEGARATGMLSASLASALVPASMLQFAIFSLAGAAVEWGRSMLDGASKTEEVLKRHKDLVDAIAESYPHAAAAAKAYEEEAAKLPQSVALADAKQQAEENRKTFEDAWNKAQVALRTFSAELDALGQQKTLPGFEVFVELADQMANGEITAAQLQKRIGEIRLDSSLRADVRAFAEDFQKIAETTAKAAANVNGMNAAIDQLDIRGGRPDRGEGSAMSAYLLRNRSSLFQLGRERDASLARIGTRSPQELADAARAREELRPVDGNESPEVRKFREDTAAAVAYAQALEQITRAQEARIRSMNQGLDTQRLELDLIGKTGAEQAKLRFEFERMQELREQAALTGVPIDDKEVEAINAAAEAMGQYADAIARAKAASDLAFEHDQLRRSTQDAAIAAMQRSAGLSIDLNSPEAKAMRENMEFSQAKDIAKGFLTTFQETLVSSGGDVGEAMGAAILNALMNSMTKQWEAIFDQLAIMFASAVTGQKGSGGIASAGSSVVGTALGAANDNYAPGAVTRAPLAQIGGGSVAEQSWNFFKSKGLADHQVAGILGNIKAESAFNPGAIGDAGKAFGLFQHHGARGGGQGLLSSGVTGQLNHAWNELQSSESGALSRLMASKDVRGATAAFAGFERPAGWSLANPESAHNFTGRLSGAEQALKQFGGTAGKATESLGTLGDGMGKMGSALNQFSAAPGGGGGGGGILGKLFGGLFGGSSSTGGIASFAKSPRISGFADGTENAPAGWAWVGEDGPELRKLRSGDVIRSNKRSAQMIAGNNNGGMPAFSPVFNIDARGSTMSRAEYEQIARQQSQAAVAEYQNKQTRGGFGTTQKRYNSMKG